MFALPIATIQNGIGAIITAIDAQHPATLLERITLEVDALLDIATCGHDASEMMMTMRAHIVARFIDADVRDRIDTVLRYAGDAAYFGHSSTADWRTYALRIIGLYIPTYQYQDC